MCSHREDLFQFFGTERCAGLQRLLRVLETADERSTVRRTIRVQGERSVDGDQHVQQTTPRHARRGQNNLD